MPKPSDYEYNLVHLPYTPSERLSAIEEMAHKDWELITIVLTDNGMYEGYFRKLFF